MEKLERQLRLLTEYEVEFVIIGGVAAIIHGSAHPTYDLDICYARNGKNLGRLAGLLRSIHARLRNAPIDLPFILDSETLRRGLNFTFQTDIGTLDILGGVAGVGMFEDAHENSIAVQMFGLNLLVLSIPALIKAKRTAGRAKDLPVAHEMEAIHELQMRKEDKSII